VQDPRRRDERQDRGAGDDRIRGQPIAVSKNGERERDEEREQAKRG